MSGRVRIVGESRKRVRNRIQTLEKGFHEFYKEYAENMAMISKGFGDVIVENTALRNLLCRNPVARFLRPLTGKRLLQEMKKVRKKLEEQANKDIREAQMKKKLDEKLQDEKPLPVKTTEVATSKDAVLQAQVH
jgi:alkylhydroperoxidase/carboxymuconolactone decarboxylase family protein YurZ